MINGKNLISLILLSDWLKPSDFLETIISKNNLNNEIKDEIKKE